MTWPLRGNTSAPVYFKSELRLNHSVDMILTPLE